MDEYASGRVALVDQSLCCTIVVPVFEQMLALATAVPYAKQPVIEKATDSIVGYTGVGTVVLNGMNRLEWGWRFVPEARGRTLAMSSAIGTFARGGGTILSGYLYGIHGIAGTAAVAGTAAAASLACFLLSRTLAATVSDTARGNQGKPDRPGGV